MRKVALIVLIITTLILLVYKLSPQPINQLVSTISKSISTVNKDSLTIASRVNAPKGFRRATYAKGSFQDYIRHYKLKPFGSKIINYDASEYYWQKGHIGILEVPVPKNGLQQCADALIRIRSEYLWDNNRKDEIGFNFTSGHYCSWSKYAKGFRPKINGNKVTFHKTATSDYSKSNFYKYLNLIYTYSGTLSLYQELKTITNVEALQIGDMLILGGSPGHIVMLADQVTNNKGENLFLLIQGNTPAQSVHLVKNLEDNALSPWYDLKLNAVIPVSNFTFYNSKFARFK
ncbi:DUF4846 domain-containing protein [Olleya sp. 1-3]|uniref:DUF4846 domain-containing protein n=1 Tax=Olleya sp. 1-3 TaxID=2058323 RepID=UPI000C3201DB|nr:DUF4846 domain-containing protein [Olleya sp. 1-3]PKG50648.1 hypothetical protein CXF54_11850 [Olleya sp. 1-3]